MLGLTVAERVTVSPTFNWMEVLSMDKDSTSINSGPTFLQAENEIRNAIDRHNNALIFTSLPTILDICSHIYHYSYKIFKLFQIALISYNLMCSLFSAGMFGQIEEHPGHATSRISVISISEIILKLLVFSEKDLVAYLRNVSGSSI